MDSAEYLAPEEINGVDLYPYCKYNPVMYSDPTGHIVITTAMIIAVVAGAIAGAIAGGFYGGMTAAANGQNVGWGILIGALSGALMGATAAAGAMLFSAGYVVAGLAIAFVGGVLGGGGGEFFSQIANNQEVDIISIAQASFQWGILNLLSAATGLLVSPELGFLANFVVGLWGSFMFGSLGLLFDILRGRDSRERQSLELIA